MKWRWGGRGGTGKGKENMGKRTCTYSILTDEWEENWWKSCQKTKSNATTECESEFGEKSNFFSFWSFVFSLLFPAICQFLCSRPSFLSLSPYWSSSLPPPVFLASTGTLSYVSCSLSCLLRPCSPFSPPHSLPLSPSCVHSDMIFNPSASTSNCR